MLSRPRGWRGLLSGLLFAILAGWVVPVGASPAPEASEAPAERPVVGLVLGGGGAKGIAHIGVLQVLEELRVPVDLVVGTSMGAGVGGLYAQGHTAAELEDLVLAVEWQTIFRDEPPRHLRSFRRRADERRFPLQLRMGIDTEQVKFPTGIVQGQRLMPWLRRQALNDPDITHFDQLPLPFRAMVVDLASGETLALEEGDVTLAIRASMAIPGIMSPVVHEGRYLVDGGLSNNLPVDVARAMGAEVVIAVDVSGAPTDVADAADPLDILQLALNVMMLRSGEEQLAHLGPGDVLLQPDVRGVGIDAVGFDRGSEAIAAGREAALHLREPLSRYRVSEAEWEAREGSRRVERTRPTPQFYRLENHSRLPDDLIRSAMASRPREGFDLATLERDMERIHGLGYFDHIDYRPVHEDGEDGIVITVEPRGWGPDYLRAGITLEEDFDGKSNYRAVVSYLQTEVGPYGAEWQTDLQVGHAPEFGTQYWQPLRRDARAYVNSHLLFSREDANVYDLGEKVGEYRNSRAVAGLDIGYYWRYWADLRLGIEAGEGQSRARTPAPDLPQRFSFNIGKLISQLTMDSLDDVFFPTSGRYLSLRHDYSLEDLGADTRYRKASGEFLGAFSSGRHTFSAGLKVGTTLAGELPLHDSFQLGGFTNLSGYQRNELTGAHLFHAQMAYLRRMNTLRGLAGVPIYTGAMLESGQVWDERQGVRVDDLVGSSSVVTVVKSAIGAVYMGASRTDDDRDSVYLSVGHPF